MSLHDQVRVKLGDIINEERSVLADNDWYSTKATEIIEMVMAAMLVPDGEPTPEQDAHPLPPQREPRPDPRRWEEPRI